MKQSYRVNSRGSKEKIIEEHFQDYLVPTQKTFEIKKGKKIEGEKKYFPGYVMINMIMNDNTWHLIKKIKESK